VLLLNYGAGVNPMKKTVKKIQKKADKKVIFTIKDDSKYSTLYLTIAIVVLALFGYLMVNVIIPLYQ
jgi:hypothetical protein